MTSHHYPRRAVAADYGRAAVGMALTFGPLVFSQAVSVMVYILGGLGTLFLVYGVRTALRHLTRVEISTDAVRVVGPVGAVLRWRELDAMRLGYYSTRHERQGSIQRERQGGWMQLELRGADRTVKLDSSIDGFPVIARHALIAARANNVVLSETTLANLAALGVAPDEPTAGA